MLNAGMQRSGEGYFCVKVFSVLMVLHSTWKFVCRAVVEPSLFWSAPGLTRSSQLSTPDIKVTTLNLYLSLGWKASIGIWKVNNSNVQDAFPDLAIAYFKLTRFNSIWFLPTPEVLLSRSTDTYVPASRSQTFGRLRLPLFNKNCCFKTWFKS